MLPPAVIKQRLDAAVDLLQLPEEAGKSLALRVPGVLLQPPGLTRSHLLSLSAVLNIPLDRATVAAAEVPQLLLLPPQEVQARLQTLCETLQVCLPLFGQSLGDVGLLLAGMLAKEVVLLTLRLLMSWCGICAALLQSPCLVLLHTVLHMITPTRPVNNATQ